MSNPLVNVSETATMLGISAYYVKKLLSEGELLGSKLGIRTYILRDSIESYISKTTEDAEHAKTESAEEKEKAKGPIHRYIYGLHTGDEKYRYIGQTNSPTKRLYVHRSTARCFTTTTAKDEWIREVGPYNVEITVLDSFDEESPEETARIEKQYILAYKAKGYDLLNVVHE